MCHVASSDDRVALLFMGSCLLFSPPLTADVKTDARAKMSVAAKMSLFKVSLCLSLLKQDPYRCS